MMFPVARVRIEWTSQDLGFVQAFCESKGMSLPVPENEEINKAINKLSIDNVGKCMVTKGLGIGL